jgi:malate synthase
MEDLATDRIYRYMIAQRTLHQVRVAGADGREVTHTPGLVSQLFDEELDRLLREAPKNGEAASTDSYRKAREQSEGMILGVLQEQGASIK